MICYETCLNSIRSSQLPFIGDLIVPWDFWRLRVYFGQLQLFKKTIVEPLHLTHQDNFSTTNSLNHGQNAIFQIALQYIFTPHCIFTVAPNKPLFFNLQVVFWEPPPSTISIGNWTFKIQKHHFFDFLWFAFRIRIIGNLIDHLLDFIFKSWFSF